MKIKLFNPNVEATEALGMEPVSYVYDTGMNIVKHFGNVFKVRLLPKIHYLVLSVGSEIDVTDPFVCSNKYDYQEHPSLVSEYTCQDSFKTMYMDKYCSGLPTNIHGRKGLIAFPYENSNLSFVLDVETEELVPMIPYVHKEVPGLECYFQRMEELYGDCSDMFVELPVPEFHPLMVRPCGEYASTEEAEYVIAYGWQISKYLRNKIHMKMTNRRVKYMVILIHKNCDDKEYVYSSKWAYENHSKIEDWMKQEGAHEKMLNDVKFSGLPCNINGRHVIVCYPFMMYNPIIWDVDDNSVYTLPSKPYPGDPYYDEIVSKYGELR